MSCLFFYLFLEMGLRPLDADDRAIHPVLPIRPQQDMTVTPPPSLVIFCLRFFPLLPPTYPFGVTVTGDIVSSLFLRRLASCALPISPNSSFSAFPFLLSSRLRSRPCLHLHLHRLRLRAPWPLLHRRHRLPLQVLPHPRLLPL